MVAVLGLISRKGCIIIASLNAKKKCCKTHAVPALKQVYYLR
jgi:hypothetical protein